MLFECRIYTPDMQLKRVVTREAIHEKFQEEYKDIMRIQRKDGTSEYRATRSGYTYDYIGGDQDADSI